MITLAEALGDARRRRVAIGHFNVSDLVALRAVTGAARALKVWGMPNDVVLPGCLLRIGWIQDLAPGSNDPRP